VVRDLLLNIRYYRTIRTYRLMRTGRCIHSVKTEPSFSINTSTSPAHRAHQVNDWQAANMAQVVSEPTMFTPIKRQSPPVTPEPAPTLLDRIVEIVDDTDSILDMTPDPRAFSPSILSDVCTRVRDSIRSLVDGPPKHKARQHQTSKVTPHKPSTTRADTTAAPASTHGAASSPHASTSQALSASNNSSSSSSSSDSDLDSSSTSSSDCSSSSTTRTLSSSNSWKPKRNSRK
jgi:hypothetical protein